MVLPAENSQYTTYAVLSEVFDTLRLLSDSMDFLNENGDGWEVFDDLCLYTSCLHGDSEANIALLLWMLRLSGYELKTYFIRNRFAHMLNWTLDTNPGLEEASNLLIDLGGPELIDDGLVLTDGCTILHENVAYGIEDLVNMVLAKGADRHPLGLWYELMPVEESPTSLAMYSSWAFTYWRRGLVAIEVDLDDFIDQELRRCASVHVGWKKEAMHDLFAYRDRPDLKPRERWKCKDCSKKITAVVIQPFWRHLLERIKQRIDPDSPAQADTEVSKNAIADYRSITEAASSSNDTRPVLNELSSESGSKSGLEEDIHGYPSTIPIRSDCVYDWDETICMSCWHYYRQTGTRFVGGLDDGSSLDEYSSSEDESSEDEYSPYLIHL